MKTDNPIDKEEIRTTISLLAEYSSKINSLIEKVGAQRRRVITLGFLLAMILIGIGIVSSILYINYSQNNQNNPENNYIIYYTLGTILVILLVFLQLIRFENRKADSIKENAYLLVSKLEKLVRRASQIEEHVKIDQSLALELDLKLSDAEGTIRMIQQSGLIKRF